MKKLFSLLGDLSFLFGWLRGWLEKRRARQFDEEQFSKMDAARDSVVDDPELYADDPDNRGRSVDP